MEEEVKISRYSTAISKEIRRGVLWEDTNRHSRSGNYVKWNEDLDTIWSELSADLTEEEYSDKENKFDFSKAKFEKFDDKIVKIGKICDSKDDTFCSMPQEFMKNRALHYKALREKEEFLRRMENSLGKGTQWRDEEEDMY